MDARQTFNNTPPGGIFSRGPIYEKTRYVIKRRHAEKSQILLHVHDRSDGGSDRACAQIT